LATVRPMHVRPLAEATLSRSLALQQCTLLNELQLSSFDETASTGSKGVAS